MKFCWVTLHVKNMDLSLKFYQEIIGLGLNRRYSPREGMEIAFLGSGETQVELISDLNAADTGVGKNVSIGFATESLDKTMAMVKEKGCAIEGGPFQPNPHIKFFYLLDPDGMTVQFVETM